MQLAKVNALGELPGCNDIVPMSLSVVDTTFSALNTNHAQEYVSVIVQNGAADVENSSAGVSIVCSP